MNRNLYARKKRQFRRLTEKVNQLQTSGQWESMDGSLQGRLIRRIKNLYDTIYGYFTRREWKKALAMAGFLLLGATGIQAQTFGGPSSNPFGLSIPPAQDWIVPTLVDLDGDGDLDILGSTYEYGRSIYYQNTGTANNPQFAAPQLSPFGLGGQYTMYSACADLDGDGDIDVLGSTVGYTGSSFSYYPNNGSATNPNFGTVQINPFGLNASAVTYLTIGSLADLDNDGDYDHIGLDYYGVAYYFQNTGTATSPAFAAPVVNAFGFVPGGVGFGKLDVGDLDLDGDLDLFSGSEYGQFYFYENTGSASAPQFGMPQINPFGMVPGGEYSFSAFGDLDDDGDLDILANGYNSSTYLASFNYYQNTDNSIGLEEQSLEATVYPSPFTSKVTVETEATSDWSVSVFDLTGKRVHQAEYNAVDRIEMDLSGLPAGIYMMQLSSQEGVVTKRITKQ